MREVIIVTYYWPPSGGGGVQRWLKFAKYLPEFGYKPIIITPEKPDFRFQDHSLTRDIPPGIEVIKLPIWEPYGIFRKLLGNSQASKQGQAIDKRNKTVLESLAVWIRGNLFIPDPRVFWVTPTARFLLKFLQSRHRPILITTGPPHSLHLIGLRVRRKLDIGWIADFRDPWGEWFQFKHLKVSRRVMRVHKKMERKVAEGADRIITVSDGLRDYFDSLNPGNVRVIRNGFDPGDFQNIGQVAPPRRFVICHAGTIDDLRNPGHFLEAYKQLCLDDPDFRKNSLIRFIGIISESYLIQFLEDPLLASQIELEDYVEHSQIGEKLQQSSVLLLLLSDFANNTGYAPGKLFEYLAVHRPILALAPAQGEAASIISTTGSGMTCEPGDVEGIRNAIKTMYLASRSGKSFETQNLDQYSRRNLTSQLVDVLESL